MKLMIYFSDEQDKYRISNKFELLLRRAIEATLEHEKVGGGCEVSLTFTDNAGIQALNKKYRNMDKPTDVLSFPQIDFENDDVDLSDDSYKILGDIVISLERAAEQAKEIGHSIEHETAFLCVHSTLHLLGYDHETGEEDEKEMFDVQKEVVATLAKDFEKFDGENK